MAARTCWLTRPAGPLVPLEDIIAATGYAGEGALVVGSGDPTASTQMVCGHFTFANGADHPLLHALPTTLHLTAVDRARQPLLDDVLQLVVRRIFQDTPGTAASISRLSEVLYIEVLRAGIDQAPELARMFSAVHDPQIGRALSVIHHRLDQDWTVDSLASEVGMSRSQFAERFRELVGLRADGILDRLASATRSCAAWSMARFGEGCRAPHRVSVAGRIQPGLCPEVRTLTEGP